MSFSIPYLLSIIIFLPLIGAIVVLSVKGDIAKKRIALWTTLLTFLVSLLLLVDWTDGSAAMQFVEDAAWFPAVRNALSFGCGRNQPVPGSADYAPYADCRLLQSPLRQ